MKAFALFILLFISSSITSQSGVQLNTEEAQQSYTLYCDQTTTYLVDNCGGIINQWPFGRFDYHLHPKLLDNGNLIAVFQTGFNDFSVKEYDWDANQLVNARINNSDIIHHYEVIKLDNGNYLTAGREILSESEIMALGYQYGVETAGGSTARPDFMDMILEIDPQGNTVWQWNVKDHMIQERSPNTANYGVVANHPELLDMDVPLQSTDWAGGESFMFNSFDYNPDLDQIAISVRKMSEIVIIDHSTTTAEAAGSTGGNSGKGGDILWRWGNPENYGQGADTDRQLYYQHNPNWIQHGEHKGKLTCYNNGRDRPTPSFDDRYSNVPIIDTKVNADGSYTLIGGEFAAELVMNYEGKADKLDFYSSYTSGAKVLPNGNIHITIGQSFNGSRMMEITPAGEKVWEYDIRESGYTYRSEKYTLDHPAFVGKDMSVKDEVFSFYDCELYTATIDILPNLTIEYQVLEDVISIQSEKPVLYNIVNTQGQSYTNGRVESPYYNIDISQLTKGIYFLTFVADEHTSKTVKFLK